MPKQKHGKSSTHTKKRQKNEVRNSSMPTKILLWLCVPIAVGVIYYFFQIYWRSSGGSVSHYDPAVIRDRTIFEVADIVGKGKGLLAVRDIKQGELLIREKPVLLLPNTLKTNTEYEAAISAQLNSLYTSQRTALFNLSYIDLHLPQYVDPSSEAEMDKIGLAIAVFQTNAVAAGVNHAGLFPKMARLNHGCAGAMNAVYSWREEELVLVVHALRDINRGEELLTAYIDTEKPREERRQYLSSHYGFNCTCSVCSLPPEQSKKSDERLTSMAAHYSALSTWMQGASSGSDAIEHVRQLLALGEEEGVLSGRALAATEAAWVAAAHSDEDATRDWAALAAKWHAAESGEDSRPVREAKGLLHSPRSHHAWGSRPSERVGGPKRVV